MTNEVYGHDPFFWWMMIVTKCQKRSIKKYTPRTFQDLKILGRPHQEMPLCNRSLFEFFSYNVEGNPYHELLNECNRTCIQDCHKIEYDTTLRYRSSHRWRDPLFESPTITKNNNNSKKKEKKEISPPNQYWYH